MTTVVCRFCSEPAVAVYEMDAGCVCFPDDREQALCPQHVIRATPLGLMTLKTDLTAGAWTKFMHDESPHELDEKRAT